MKKIKFFGKVINGIVQYYKPQARIQWLISMEGKEIQEELDEREYDQTNDQRGYYRATNRWLIYNTEAFGGYTEEDIHDLALSMFSRHVRTLIVSNKTIEITVITKTSDMNRKTFSRFLNEWIQWLAISESIYVPTPEEAILDKYKTVKHPLTKEANSKDERKNKKI